MRALVFLALFVSSVAFADEDKGRFKLFESGDNGAGALMVDSTNGNTWRLCHPQEHPSNWSWCRVDREPTPQEEVKLFADVAKRMGKRIFNSAEERDAEWQRLYAQAKTAAGFH